MDDKRLKKLGEELEKARAKQAEWTERARDLERKYREAENICIHEMVRAAEVSPEELVVILQRAKAGDFDRRGEQPANDENGEEVVIHE